MEAEELVGLLKLHDSVYEQANSWFTSLKDNMKSQILSHFGHLPSKDPDPQVCRCLRSIVSQPPSLQNYIQYKRTMKQDAS